MYVLLILLLRPWTINLPSAGWRTRTSPRCTGNFCRSILNSSPLLLLAASAASSSRAFRSYKHARECAQGHTPICTCHVLLLSSLPPPLPAYSLEPSASTRACSTFARTQSGTHSHARERARTRHTPAPPKAPALSSSFPPTPSLRPPSASSGQDSHLRPWREAEKPNLVNRA